MSDPTSKQPAPIPSTGDVWELVIRDMEKRRQFGISKYNTPLQINNGRRVIADLVQELLDAIAYTYQHAEEMRWLRDELLEIARMNRDGEFAEYDIERILKHPMFPED